MSTTRQHVGMTGYTKLFASILDSTIWREGDKTRIVWITMLAMANQWGDVEASIPGLADRARVSVEEVKAALVVLSSPDDYSRTKDFDGRRVQEIDGGWRILNHGKYREKMSQDQRREYLTQKQRERRERLKRQQTVNTCQHPSTDVNDSQSLSTSSTHAEADSEAQAEAKAEKKTPPNPQGGNGTYSPDFDDFWAHYPNKTGKGAAWKAWERAKGKPAIIDLIAAVRRDQATEKWRKDGGQFIPNPSTWLNQRRWEDAGLALLQSAKPDVSDWHEEKAKWAKP